MNCALGNLAVDEVVTVTIVATVDPAYFTDGNVSPVANTATVVTDTPDPDPANDTALAETTIEDQADLAVAKSDAPDPVTAGNDLTYTVTVENLGPGNAATVVLDDPLPAGLTFISAAPDNGATCDATVSCALGTLPAGDVVTVTIVATVDASFFTDGNTSPIVNTASVSAATPDPEPANDEATVDTTVEESADLTVTKVHDPDPVTAGEDLAYTITVENLGPSEAQAVVVDDPLPAGLTLVSATADNGAACDTTVSCGLGTLGVNEVVTVTIVAAVDASFFTDGNSSPITNTATVSADTPDPDAGNDTATVATAVDDSADLAVTKTDSPDPVAAGSDLTYTVTIENLGPSDSASVELDDPLPAGVTLVSATADNGATCDGAVNCAIGDMAAGDLVTVTVVVNVDSTFFVDGNLSPITNTATASAATPDPAAGNGAATTETTVTAAADVSIAKDDAPDPVVAGEPLTWTLTIDNTGPSVAEAVVVTDLLPPGVSLVTAAADNGGTCDPNVVCTLGDVGAGGQVIVTVDVLVDADFFTAGNTSPISNTATVSATTADPNPLDNEDIEDTTVVDAGDLTISKDDLPDPVTAGEDLTYTITVMNAGSSDAQNVVVDDPLPAGLTVLSADADNGGICDFSVNCDLGTVAAGTTVVITVVATVDPSFFTDGRVSPISNTATVTSTTPDDTSDNTAGEDTTVLDLADLALAKVDDPDPVTAGETLTYTVTVENLGPSDAQGVVLDDPLPAGVTFLSAAADNGASCDETVNCGLGTVAAGEIVTVTIVATVDASFFSDGNTSPIFNTATVSSDTPDPDAGNDSATADTTVVDSADLAVAKVDDPDPVTAGETLTYTVTVENLGPSDAQGVVLDDPLPAGVTFLSAAADNGASCDETVNCGLGTVAAGEIVTVTIVATVDASFFSDGNTSPIFNTATVSSDTPDPDAGNDSATADTTVVDSADLAVAKVDDPDPVTAGETLTYTVTVENLGPSDAQGVVLDDPLPAGVTFLSAAADNGASCDETVNCGLGTIPAGETVTVTILVTVDASYFTDGNVSPIVNTAQANSDTPDPALGNNSDGQTTAVIASADIAASKIDTPDPVVAGEDLTYTITVENLGPSDAQNGAMEDILPPGLTLVSVTPDTGTCDTVITCALGTIAAGASVGVVIVATVDASYFTDGNISPIQNGARANSDTPDPNIGNDIAGASTTVVESADLVVTKTDDPDPVTAGTDLTYTVTVENLGPSDAQDVVLDDPLPAGLTFVSATPDNGATCDATVSCALGTLAAGDTVTVTIVATVDAGYFTAGNVSPVVNTATATANTSDPDGGNNTATEETTVDARADLTLTKSDDPDPVTAGLDLTYTVMVENLGPSDAQNVVLDDPLPPGLTWVAATPDNGGTCDASVNCALGAVAAGETVIVTIVATVDASFFTDGNVSAVVNTASVASDTPDPSVEDNIATEETVVVDSADLSITKTDDPDPVVAGAVLTYTLEVTNAGPSDAQGVSAIDTPPVEVTFTTVETDRGDVCDLTASCDLATIAAGEVVTITLAGVVAGDTPDGTVTNSTEVTSPTPDPDVANNVAVADTQVLAPRIGAAKAIPTTPTNNGDGTFTLTYSVLVENFGSTELTELQVVDSLADTFAAAVGFSVDGLTSTDLTINPAYDGDTDPNLLSGVDTLGIGATATVEVTVTVEPGATLGPYANTATASGLSPAGFVLTDDSQSGTDPDPDGDGDPTNNNDPTVVTFGEEPAMTLTKTVASGPTSAGDGTAGVVFSIELANIGDIELRNVQVTDDLAALFTGVEGFTVGDVTASGLTVNPGYDGATDTDLLAGTDTLAVGESTTILISLTVTPGAAFGPFVNTAVAAAETPGGTLLSEAADATSAVQFDAASAQGTVWWDADRNGVKDPDEQLIGGVTVNLLDAFGTLVATTVTTDPSPQATEARARVERAPATSVPFNYRFTGIVPGAEYSVSVNETTFPSGYVLVSTTADAAADGSYPFIALSGVTELDLDFGLDVDEATLPRTGTDVDRMALYGLALLAAGLVLVLAVRRRNGPPRAV